MKEQEALIKKLKLHQFEKKSVWNQPEDFDDLSSVAFDTDSADERVDLILAFCWSPEEMKAAAALVAEKDLLRPNGYLYLAYPKKGNRKYDSYVGRDDIFPAFEIEEADGRVKGTPLVFSRMVSLNDTFTIVGLKHQATDKKRSGSAASQRVDDYIRYLPQLEEALTGAVREKYDTLAPGYRKGWARYVYSAKTEPTRQKRLLEMEKILLAGYPSKEVYRAKTK